MVYAIPDSQSDLASTDMEGEEEDKADDEEDTEQGKLNEHDEPSWLICTISRMVQY
jgi:hypothetical protein